MVCGAACGALHLQGFVILVAYCIALHLLAQMYHRSVLNANEDDFPNMELVMEGTGNAFGLFLLVWVLAFTFA